MTQNPCDFDRFIGLGGFTLDDARNTVTAMLRCAARHACERALVCSDTAIDSLNDLVLRRRPERQDGAIPL